MRRIVALLLILTLILLAVRWLRRAPHRAERPQPEQTQTPLPSPPLPPPQPSPPPEVPETQEELLAGQQVTIQLTEPPAERYLETKTDENDAFYARIVREESHGKAIFDPALGRAAREFVYQFANLGMDPPSDVRTFLTTAAGAVAGDTVFQHVRSNSDAEGALRQAIRAVLEAPPGGSGLLHVGVGEVYQPGASLSRSIGVVGTPLGLDVEPLNRRVELGQTWTLRGALRVPWKDLHALVLQPDGKLDTLAVQVVEKRLEVLVNAGQTRGTQQVQVVGEGPEGPGKLVQVAVEVGQPLPTTYRATLPPDETTIHKADEAAAYAFALLNADRRKFHVPPLIWDAKLAEIARDHSADMRDHGFFGHVSPTTGLHTQRLAQNQYQAVASAENVAQNPSVFEAELGLMHSLGHRRNILDPELTHVGVGVAGAEDERGRRRWWVTQLFTRPVEHLAQTDAVDRVRQAIGDLRAQAGLQPLQPDAALDEVAANAVQLALDERMSDASNRALELARERQILRGRLRVWTALTPELRQLHWPEAAKVPEARRLGVAVAQRADGRLAVILLVADEQ